MRRSEVFPSKWLRNEDLNGKPLVVTVQSAEMQELKSPDGKTAKKMVLSFKETDKSFVLNLTNWDSVAEILGDDSDNWQSGKIELFPARTQMGGKVVACVRVRPPATVTPSQAPTRRPVAEAAVEELNDEIVF
jgi:hypothetical protein